MVVGQVAAAGEDGALAGVPERDVRRLDVLGRWRGGEREVEAGAVAVAVREVAAGDEGVRAPRVSAARTVVEQAGQPRPRGGDLHRVDDEAPPASGPAAPTCRCGGRASRRRGRPPSRRPAAVQHSATTRHRGVDDAAGRPRRARAARTGCRRRRGRAAASTASYSRSTAGVAPRRITWRQASMPSANVSNDHADRRSAGASGWARSHTRVTIPSVPSEPRNSWVRSGPTAAAGAPPVRTTVAVGEHDLEADGDVLDLAVAGRVLAGAAARDPAADRGDVEALREVPDAEAVGLLQLALEVGPERAGEHLDDARTSRRRRRCRRARWCRARRRRTPGRRRR